MQIQSKMDDGFSKRKQKPCKRCRFYTWTMLRTRKNSGTVIMTWPCSPVLCCNSDCVLQITVDFCRSHWSSGIQDTIWMLGFAPNIVFFRVNGSSAAEKSWLACATVSGVAPLPSNLSRIARSVTEVSRWLCVCCCWRCAVVFCISVCADRSGMAALRSLIILL